MVALERVAHPREPLAGHPPGAHGAAQARGRDALGLQVRHQLGQLGRGAGAHARDPPEQALPRERTQRRGGLTGAQEHLAQEALEALDAHAESQPSLGQLAPVARLVGLGGHDQERVLAVRRVGPDRLQHEARLARVGGSGD